MSVLSTQDLGQTAVWVSLGTKCSLQHGQQLRYAGHTRCCAKCICSESILVCDPRCYELTSHAGAYTVDVAGLVRVMKPCTIRNSKVEKHGHVLLVSSFHHIRA